MDTEKGFLKKVAFKLDLEVLNNILTGEDEVEGMKTQWSGRKHRMHEGDTGK